MKNVKKWKKLVVGLILVGIFFLGEHEIMFSSPTEPYVTGWLDIWYIDENDSLYKDKIPYISLRPVWNTYRDISFEIAWGWGLQEKRPKQIKIFVPGMREDYEVLKILEETNQYGVPTVSGVVEDLDKIYITHHEISNGDEIFIDTDKFLGFVGIKFIWKGGINRINFSTYRIDLPLQTNEKYNIRIQFPPDYTRISSMPEPSKYERYFREDFYTFEIDGTTGDLNLTFVNTDRAKREKILHGILFVLLGIGLTLIVENLWMYGEKRLEGLKDIEEKSKKATGEETEKFEPKKSKGEVTKEKSKSKKKE